MSNKFYNVLEQNGEGVVDIFGDINWIDNDEHTFKNDLDKITADNITVRINSGGGDVFTGHTIYNMIKQTNKRVKVVVNGLAASIASVIAMAGDVVEMPSNAMLMIHNPSCYSGGTAEDMRKTADTLDKVAETIKAVYVNRTGLSDEEITQMMNDETWLTAQEAKDKGFCDIITDEIKIDNSSNRKFFNSYKHTPTNLTDVQDSSDDELKLRLNNLENQVTALKAELTELQNKEEDESKTEVESVQNAWSSFFVK